MAYFVLMLGGSILGIKFLDPLAGIVLSGMILKAGLETGMTMDGEPFIACDVCAVPICRPCSIFGCSLAWRLKRRGPKKQQ
ncbi:hypothetical protein U1Q18_001381, partial [Sarracenia purpurea var. burkii]